MDKTIELLNNLINLVQSYEMHLEDAYNHLSEHSPEIIKIFCTQDKKAFVSYARLLLKDIKARRIEKLEEEIARLQDELDEHKRG